MTKKTIFGLLTDFGLDFAVASMKALLIKEVPDSCIIDIDHNVNKFSVKSGAFIIDKVYKYFPKGSIFICIIDPGVGSQREALCINFDGYIFFGPNNGLFNSILNQKEIEVYSINEEIIKPESNTFHGRDIFVPAATRLIKGCRDFLIPWDNNQKIILQNNNNFIGYIDSFGNIKTTIVPDKTFIYDSIFHILIENKKYQIPFVKTFSQIPKGSLLCYLGSNGTLEIAVNLGSAQKHLQAQVGDTVVLISH